MASDGVSWAEGPIMDHVSGDFSRMAGPVLLSVPHAGRHYSAAVVAQSRMGLPVLHHLEDRYADLLVTALAEDGYSTLVCHVPRAVLDLNRDPRDIDTIMVRGIPHGYPLIRSVKQRGGLGLFPRALPRYGDLWRGAMLWQDARERIDLLHQLYHSAVEQELVRLHRHFGQVLLLDVHSMPPLSAGPSQQSRPDIVIGNRYGASSSSSLVESAEDYLIGEGLHVAINHPYAGSYLLERHGQPHKGHHALQIEISRDLYLDAALQEPGEGLAWMQRVVRGLVHHLARQMNSDQWSEAAE